ncbi:non-ribosomal peptide synthetase [Vibrio pectenicida]|uniref:Amino acid adenylation domain-containing protein n=1 Tax=Vibrio pectenicida TaxID=62763 RepID=A0A427TV70_9VIBR|nr:amino acid adenylation domain-containing protein [Vibrio pectenicida]RSD28378.1 amino acid adenylation domain-containing protein [Vibrio pectenicida]
MSKLVHVQFAKQCLITPNNIALRSLNENITYRELELRTDTIAQKLLSFGVRPGDVVGVYMDRSNNLVATLLGIMKTGACYLPLDPYYPHNRLSYMVEHSEAKLVVTDRPYEMDWLPVECEYIDITSVDFSQSVSPTLPDIDEQQLCYIMYTSGSTGTPKGVMVAHNTVVNYLNWMQEAFQLEQDSRVLSQTTYSFDISVWEIFWPLTTGASTALICEEAKYDPVLLADFIRHHQVTVAQFVPTALRIIVDAGVLDKCHSLEHIFSGGEALPQCLVDDLSQQFHGDIHNLYGPTEATIFACHWQCQPNTTSEAIVPIGFPIPHAQVLILNEELELVEQGCRGELYLSGDILALGYLKREDLTTERFLVNPYSTGAKAKMYRTGDLVSLRKDGALLFHGRIDSQIKLRGHRIELAEIEAQLQALPYVSHAAVIVDGSDDGKKQHLTAFYVPYQHRDTDIQAIKREMAEILPYYMQPSRYYAVDSLPTLPNGKISKSALSAK